MWCEQQVGLPMVILSDALAYEETLKNTFIYLHLKVEILLKFRYNFSELAIEISKNTFGWTALNHFEKMKH